MKKSIGWILSIISVLSVASVAVSVVLLGRMTTMSGDLGKLATQVTVVQQGESTILSKTSRASQPSNTSSANTTNTAGNTTVNATNSTTGSSGNSTAPVTTQFTAAEAVKIANTIPGIQANAQTDPNFTAIPQGTQVSSKGYIYITVEYADKMPNHISALYWIDVRADGLVRNHMTQGAWVQPSQLTLSY